MSERKVRALLIDPWQHSVTTLEIDESADWHPIIGADCLDVTDLGNGIQAGLPDTGIVEGLPACLLFAVRRPLAGRVLLVGYDEHGATVDCPVLSVDLHPIWLSGKTAQEIVRSEIRRSAIEAAARGDSVETTVDGFLNIITTGGNPS